MTVPIYNMTDAWTDGSLYTAIKMNVTDTSSNAASLLMDLQVAGTSVFSVGKAGPVAIRLASGQAANTLSFLNSSGTAVSRVTSDAANWQTTGAMTVTDSGFSNGLIRIRALTSQGLLDLVASGQIGWTSGTSVSTNDTMLTRGAAATLQLGDANAASPVAQTVRAQGSRAGTDTNIGGANLTVQPGIGTGTGTPSNLVLNGMVGTTTGTGTQAVSAALTVVGAATGQVPSVVLGSAAIGTTATDGFLYITSCAGAPSGVPTTQTGRVALAYDTSTHQFWIYDSGWKQPKTPAGAAIVTWQ